MGFQDTGMWPLIFPVKTSVLINFSNPCFAKVQALSYNHTCSIIIFLWRQNSKQNWIAVPKSVSPVPKNVAQPTFYSAWGIYGTLEGCNFIFRAQPLKWQVILPWQNCPGIHVTADLQLYLSFVHYFPKQTELHGQWITKPLLSKEQDKAKINVKAESMLQLWTPIPVTLECTQEPCA